MNDRPARPATNFGNGAVRAVLWVLLSLPLTGLADASGWRTVSVGGRPCVALPHMASYYGFRLRDSRGQKPTLSSQWSVMEFEGGGRRVRFNDGLLWLHTPLVQWRGHWAVDETDMRFVVDPLLRRDVYLRDCGFQVVVLDPGHGGRDLGARGARGVEEKRVALDVARRLRVHLVQSGVRVVMTREDDRYVSLSERTAIAARHKGDLFISIHVNASSSPSARGVETYIMTAPGHLSTNTRRDARPNPAAYPGNRHHGANAVLGWNLQRAMVQRLNAEDRGLRLARFQVLRDAPCPAALVECGFVSNREEEALFLRASYREEISRALATGVLNYLGAVKRARLGAP